LIIAFITRNSSLVPLLEGLCSSNPGTFEFSVFGVFAGVEPTTSKSTVRALTNCTIFTSSRINKPASISSMTLISLERPVKSTRHCFSTRIFPRTFEVGLGISRTTRILIEIQFTTHFIEILVMETKRSVDSFVNAVILMRQTCGQHSSRTAESKRRALGNYFSERICYTFLYQIVEEADI